MSSTESRCDLLCYDLSDRTRLQLTGRDRVKFLHNLSTNDIKKLAPQQGCEIFVPTLQGKILGHFFALPINDSILLSGVPGQAEPLLPHFQKYAVIEDVELVDRTDATSELLLVGPQAESWLAENLSITPPQESLQLIGQEDLIIYRSPYVAQPAWGVIFLNDSPLREKFNAVERTATTNAELDSLRIEAGFPAYGRDITVDNLCQEAARDASAISFTKGCYLGQETIARIDALGHVNRRLLGVQFASQPSADAVYEIEGKPVLTVTSTAYSPTLDQWIGLAMVRRGFDKPGETLETSSGPVKIVALPFSA